VCIYKIYRRLTITQNKINNTLKKIKIAKVDLLLRKFLLIIFKDIVKITITFFYKLHKNSLYLYF